MFYCYKNIYYTVALWVLTGFGGDNVFCIKKALSDKVKYDKNAWFLFEQIGHIVGVTFALTIAMVCNERIYDNGSIICFTNNSDYYLYSEETEKLMRVIGIIVEYNPL